MNLIFKLGVDKVDVEGTLRGDFQETDYWEIDGTGWGFSIIEIKAREKKK